VTQASLRHDRGAPFTLEHAIATYGLPFHAAAPICESEESTKVDVDPEADIDWMRLPHAGTSKRSVAHTPGAAPDITLASHQANR